MNEELKNIENWYMPNKEKSLLKKLKSTRDSIGDQFKIDQYQEDLRNKAISYVKNKKSVIDVGAHIGIWSVAFSKVFEMVHSFEVNPDVIASLRLNIENRNIKNVTIYPFGLGSQEEMVELTQTKTKSMGVSVKPNSKGLIQIKNLDSLNLHADLIKIDVEGYEPHVLLGAEATIRNCKPIIVMEDKDLYKNYDLISPSEFLTKKLGMIELNRYRKDVIFGWKE